MKDFKVLNPMVASSSQSNNTNSKNNNDNNNNNYQLFIARHESGVVLDVFYILSHVYLHPHFKEETHEV